MNISIKSKTLQTIFFIAIPLILAAITFATYYPSLSYEFQFDDIVNIKKYFYARTNNFFSLAFGSSRWISFWLNTVAYKLAKHDPFYYRLFNVLCHIMTGLLVYAFTFLGLSKLSQTNYFFRRRIILATTVTILFLLHPVQTQTVSYVIQGQLEGLATFFVMIILTLFLAATSTHHKITQYLAYAALFAAGFISTGTKEIAIISPLLLLLTDWFFVAQGSFKKLKPRLIFHSIYTACLMKWYYKYVFTNVIVTDAFKGKATLMNNVGNVITPHAGEHIKVWGYFISQFKVILHYMAMFLWPFSISVDYDWKMVSDFFSPDCLGPFLLLVSIVGLTVYLLYRNTISLIGFGMLWFFVCLAPRSSFIPSTELIADYKTYMASIGYLLVLSTALVYLLETSLSYVLASARARTMYSSGILTCSIALLCFATYQRNTVWRSGEEFWYNIIQNSPKKARAYNNYAVALAEKGRYQDAIPYLRKAIKLDQYYPDPWSNISVCYNHTGKVDLAINTMQEAIKINPSYPEFYNNLSSYFLTKKEFEKSIYFAQEAIKRRAYYGKPHFNLGKSLAALGKYDEALEYIRKSCIECDYDTIEATSQYAQMAVQLGKYDHAIIALEQLHRMVPQDLETFFNLGTAYYFEGNFEKAAATFAALTQNFPEDHRSWFNLAESYMKLNQPEQALACYQKALPIQTHYPEVTARLTECQNILKSHPQYT